MSKQSEEKKHLFRYEEVDLDELGSIGSDQKIFKDFPGEKPLGLRITFLDAETEMPLTEGATALYFRDSGRLGISQGADPTFGWVDNNDLEEAIDCYINRSEEWEARN